MHRTPRLFAGLGLISLLLAGCGPLSEPAPAVEAARPAEAATAAPTPTPPPTVTQAPAPTATFTATAPPPTPSATPPAAPTPLAGPFALFTFSSYGPFGGLYAGWQPGVRRPLYQASEEDPARPGSPADAARIAFAHYAPRVAYLLARPAGAQLWLADMALTEPRLILDDPAGAVFPKEEVGREKVRLSWSADDQHLFVTLPGAEASFVVHTLTGRREPWPYRCDRVALSPRSGRLAEWCQGLGEVQGWAVVEWGGVIWSSRAGPAQPLTALAATEAGPRWAWSRDGAQVAYFDSAAARAGLHVADSSGERLIAAEAVQGDGDGVQWSQDGRRLLARLDPSAGHPCPVYRDPLSALSRTKEYTPPCWQVLAADTGQVLWSVGEAAGPLEAALGAGGLEYWYFEGARLSPDGGEIALVVEQPGVYTGVILDLAAGQVRGSFPGPADSLSWGALP